jgi:hypothetical protein
MRKYLSGRLARLPAISPLRSLRRPPALTVLALWLLLPTGPVLAASPGGQSPWGGLALLVVGVFILVLLGGLLLIKFSAPLTELERISRQMAACQLQELVPEQNIKCRLTGRIGANINELSLNFQEVLLLVWNLSHQDLEALERIARHVEGEVSTDRQPVKKDLEFIRKDLEEMQEIVRQFEFFNVVMQDGKLLAKPEPTTVQEREE